MLKKFGDDAWLLFQYVDDYLGVLWDETITGKSVMTDIIDGKATLFSAYMHDDAEFMSLYGTDITSDHYSWMKQRLIDADAVSFYYSKIVALHTKLKQYIPLITNNSDYQEILYSFIDFVYQRTK